MEHTKIVTPSELEDFADRRDSEPVLPEFVATLLNLSVPDLTLCRIPCQQAERRTGEVVAESAAVKGISARTGHGKGRAEAAMGSNLLQETKGGRHGRPCFCTTSPHTAVTAVSGRFPAVGALGPAPFLPFPFSSASSSGFVNPRGGRYSHPITWHISAFRRLMSSLIF